jgi:hypothetical protein
VLKVGKVACRRYLLEWIDFIAVATQDFIICRIKHDICLEKREPQATGTYEVSSKVYPEKFWGVSGQECPCDVRRYLSFFIPECLRCCSGLFNSTAWL